MESRYEVDSVFYGSKSKPVCQDYCLSGKDPFPYVIISDGCSSSPHTDIGARIITHVAKDMVTKVQEERALKNDVMIISSYIARTLNLPRESLDCTLGMIYIVGDSVYIRLYGDGIIIYKYNDCKGFIHITYDKNAPYYPSYLLSPNRDEQYEKMNNRTYHHQVHHRIHEDIIEDENSTRDFTHDYKANTPSEEIFTTDGLEYILIASDGLASFTPEIPLEEVVELFTSFKSTKGEFIKRRAKRALKELTERGIYNQDDISIGAILIA